MSNESNKEESKNSNHKLSNEEDYVKLVNYFRPFTPSEKPISD
jgi:hypothetical protein